MYLPPFTRSPLRAAAPTDARMAMGVARAKEQEQATTRTATVAMASPLKA